MRHGHNYAARIVTRLLEAGLLPSGGAAGTLAEALDEGVVRVSLLHYNTPDEVHGLTRALGEILDQAAAAAAVDS